MSAKNTERTRTLLARLAGCEIDTAAFAPGRVRAVLGADVAQKGQAQLAFSLLANLLARLHPVVQSLDLVLPREASVTTTLPRWHAPSLGGHLERMLSALRPQATWRVGDQLDGDCECVVALGDVDALPTEPVFLGSEGWEASVAPGTTLPIGDAVNPVGAYAAACLAVAEVWKRLLLRADLAMSGIPVVALDAPLSFSTFTYGVGRNEPNPALPHVVSIERLTMIGLGAGGGAAAYTFASLPGLTATVDVVEPDRLEPTNHNRYVYADEDDLEQNLLKTDVVAAMLRARPGMAVNDHPCPFSEARLAPSLFKYVLAAVHSREARREIQMETPMVLWDAAAAEDGEFRVWRLVQQVTECMFCKHPLHQDPERAKANQLSSLLGLEPGIWLRKIRDNEPFATNEVAAMRLPSDAGYPLPSPGQRYAEWEAAYCGLLRLPDDDAAVPVPFAPVMAGILLAGEVIKEHHFPEAVLDSYYWNTLMGNFMRGNRPKRRLPNRDCTFCNDTAWRAQHDRRWGRTN